MKDLVSNPRFSVIALLTSVALVSMAGMVVPPLQAAPPEAQDGARAQILEGSRYETLRALADHLDQTAQGALEGARNETRRGSSSSARFLWSIRSFAERAAAFNKLIGEYRGAPFAVAPRVDDLSILAHQVNDRIRCAGVLENTDSDWQAVLDDLERMSSLLDGHEVEVPAPHVVAALSGSRLREFRQLASDVDRNASRAHESAKRDVGDYPRGRQFLEELHYFATQSRGLHSQAEAVPVNPQQIGPSVHGLLEDARQADRRMRDALVFKSVWEDSSRTIILLQRMAGLVRS